MRSRQRQVDVARLLDRFATVERLEHREFPRTLLQDPRDPEEVLGALRGGDPGPTVLECVARGSDRRLHFLGSRLGDLCERLFGRGRDRRVGLARLEPRPAHVVAVALFEPDDVPSLRRGCIRPLLRNRGPIALSLEVSQR